MIRAKLPLTTRRFRRGFMGYMQLGHVADTMLSLGGVLSSWLSCMLSINYM